MDVYLRWQLMQHLSVIEPRFVHHGLSDPGELLGEVWDLWYDVVEHPEALSRIADDGCPNHGEAP